MIERSCRFKSCFPHQASASEGTPQRLFFIEAERTHLTKNEANREHTRFEISVRSLAEHVHRTGGLSPLSFSGISGSDGTRLHTRVFSDLKKQYRPTDVETEVSLSAENIDGDLTLVIRGRADCIIHLRDSNNTDEIMILEVKSCNSDFT